MFGKHAVLIFMVVSAILIATTQSFAAAGKRVALVVGNGAYTNAPALDNPVTDARAISATLKRLGFEIVEGYDLDKPALENTVRDFSRAAKDAELSLFFYAGHGIAVANRNYIIPVDARFSDSSALDFEAVPVELVTKQMQYSQGVSLVFLDACRDNPLARTLARSIGSGTRSAGIGPGLAEMKIRNPGKGLAIAFATSPGAVAYDGDGKHSPFTAALLKHIDEPNTDITEVMSRVTGEVVRSTGEKQRPWLNTSLTGSVVLNPVFDEPEKPEVAESAAAAEQAPKLALGGKPDKLEHQKVLYDLARETDRVDDYRAYLEKFPDGLFSANARKAIERLGGKPKQVAKLTVDKASGHEGGAAAAKTTSIKPVEPVALPVTDQVAKANANEATEAALAMDRAKREEVQLRLNLAGHDTGKPDGVFGPATRDGIRSWQTASGIEASGYLNAPQLEILMLQTEQALVAYVPPKEAAPAPRVTKKTVTRKAAKTRTVTRKRPVRKAKAKRPKKKAVAKRKAKRKKSTRVARKRPRRVHRAPRDTAERRPIERDYDRDRRRSAARAAVAGAIVGGILGGVIVHRRRK